MKLSNLSISLTALAPFIIAFSLATSQSALAATECGAGGSATATSDTSCGDSADATGGNSTAIGASSDARASRATAVGRDANAMAVNSTAIGAETDIDILSQGGVALGQDANIQELSRDGIAIGSESGVLPNSIGAIAIGGNPSGDGAGAEIDAQRPGHVQQGQLGGVATFLLGPGGVDLCLVELRVVAGDDRGGHPDRCRARVDVIGGCGEVDDLP